METSKIIGYALLIIGVILIAGPLWQTYEIFTGHGAPSQIFTRPVALQPNPNVSSFDVQGQMQNALIKILPIDFIDNILNLGAWLLLGWILMYGGGKIAQIGVQLLNGTK